MLRRGCVKGIKPRHWSVLGLVAVAAALMQVWRRGQRLWVCERRPRRYTHVLLLSAFLKLCVLGILAQESDEFMAQLDPTHAERTAMSFEQLLQDRTKYHPIVLGLPEATPPVDEPAAAAIHMLQTDRAAGGDCATLFQLPATLPLEVKPSRIPRITSTPHTHLFLSPSEKPSDVNLKRRCWRRRLSTAVVCSFPLSP